MANLRYTKLAAVMLTPELHQKTKDEAKRLKISMGDFMRYFLFKYFDEKESIGEKEIKDIVEVEIKTNTNAVKEKINKNVVTMVITPKTKSISALADMIDDFERKE